MTLRVSVTSSSTDSERTTLELSRAEITVTSSNTHSLQLDDKAPETDDKEL